MKFCYQSGMKVYVAGPITGVKDYRARFDKAEVWLRRAMPGVKVFNPAKLPGGKDNRWYMLRCLVMVLRSDALFLLEGWNCSSGAKIEVALARYCGIPVVLDGQWYDGVRGESCDSLVGNNAEAQ